MGVHLFMSWLCRRYPLLGHRLDDPSSLRVDNLYIKLNMRMYITFQSTCNPRSLFLVNQYSWYSRQMKFLYLWMVPYAKTVYQLKKRHAIMEVPKTERNHYYVSNMLTHPNACYSQPLRCVTWMTHLSRNAISIDTQVNRYCRTWQAWRVRPPNSTNSIPSSYVHHNCICHYFWFH